MPDDVDLPDAAWGPLNPVYSAGTPSRVTNVRITQLYGDPLEGKPKGVRIDQGTSTWLSLPLHDPQTSGPLVVSVNAYSTAPTAVVRYREATGIVPDTYEPDDGDVAYLSSDGASVVLPVPEGVRDTPGVYRAQVRLADGASGAEIARDEFWLWVDRGLFLSDGSAPADDKGPPSFSEVRTALRDHPGANRLLGEYEFDAAEIAQAVVWAVGAFNTELPPVPKLFTTISWPTPWRRSLLLGATAQLFDTASHYHRRGHLPYQAGGLSVDDLAKEKDYQAAAERARAEYLRWVKLKKAQFNIQAGWGSVGSGHAPWRVG